MTWITCPTCGKRSYLSLHEARKARRSLPNHKGMTVYPCGGYWHTGHLPEVVRKGRLTRGEIYDERDDG